MNYYIYYNEEIIGPYTFDKMQEMVQSQIIHDNSYVCLEGSSEWIQASSIDSLFNNDTDTTSNTEDNNDIDVNIDSSLEDYINSSNKTKDDIPLLKKIRLNIFSNPLKGLWSYFIRLWAFTKLTMLQFRNPLFRIDMDEDYSVAQTGGLFKIFHFFLNPFGKIKYSKVEKLNIGCVEYTREAISMLFFTILLQLAFLELAEIPTSGNLAVALINGILVGIFYITIFIIVKLGNFVTRKIDDKSVKRSVEELFVYESTMIFGFIVLINTLDAFELMSINSGLGFGFLFIAMHPFYLLFGLNNRFKFTNLLGVIFYGILFSVVSSFTFLFAFVFATILNTPQ